MHKKKCSFSCYHLLYWPYTICDRKEPLSCNLSCKQLLFYLDHVGSLQHNSESEVYTCSAGINFEHYLEGPTANPIEAVYLNGGLKANNTRLFKSSSVIKLISLKKKDSNE